MILPTNKADMAISTRLACATAFVKIAINALAWRVWSGSYIGQGLVGLDLVGLPDQEVTALSIIKGPDDGVVLAEKNTWSYEGSVVGPNRLKLIDY